MEFARPFLLLLLILPVIFGVIWMVLARQRSAFALRLADASLFDGMVTARPGWRELVGGIGLLLASALIIVAAAGPQVEHYEDVESSTVVLVFDISVSMLADDVQPNRLRAAKDAAQQFIDTLPDHVRLGLVTFNQTVTPAVNPRTSREEVKRALANAEPDFGTAMGDAIASAVSMIKADLQNRNITSTAGSAIVLLGDGDVTVGNPASWGADQAAKAKIPVSTIAFGTLAGVITIDGGTFPAPADRQQLQAVARRTQGEFFESSDLASLKGAFDRLAKITGKELVKDEFTWPWLIGALVLIFAAFGSNLIWFRRLL